MQKMKRFTGWILLAAVLGHYAANVTAAEKLPVPPFQIAGSNHVIVGVAWQESEIAKMLPPGIRPVPGATGAINIYQASKGFGISPYQSVYFFVDIEGYDSADGSKGRWMLQGVYGPEEKVSAALREFYAFPVRNGSSRVETRGQMKRSTGVLNGETFVTVDIKPSNDPCQGVAGTLNYPAMHPRTGQIIVNQIPYAGDMCKAEPVAVKISAPAGDPFAALQPAKVLWAVEFKNGSFAFTQPVVMP